MRLVVGSPLSAQLSRKVLYKYLRVYHLLSFLHSQLFFISTEWLLLLLLGVFKQNHARHLQRERVE